MLRRIVADVTGRAVAAAANAEPGAMGVALLVGAAAGWVGERVRRRRRAARVAPDAGRAGDARAEYQPRLEQYHRPLRQTVRRLASESERSGMVAGWGPPGRTETDACNWEAQASHWSSRAKLRQRTGR